jgi:hypothetical protein
MSIGNAPRSVFLLAVFAVFWPARAWAESWPSLDDLASPRFLLIAHCCAEEVEGRTLYKVLDVWKGEYSPQAFAKRPPDGYIVVPSLAGSDVDRMAVKEVILFYTRGNQSKEGISQVDMVLPVRDGKVMYPPDAGEFSGEQRTYTLAEFKQELTSRIGKPPASDAAAAESEAARAASDYSGAWRMLLPAGFDLAAKLEAMAENRYRFTSGGSRFNGVYELRGNRLVMVEPKESRLEGFAFEVRSRYLLTLVEQSAKLEHDYRGAVLFRPSAAALQRATSRSKSPSVSDDRALKSVR